jgi:hypothetical protein
LFGELTLFAGTKKNHGDENLFIFGVKHDMMMKNNNARPSKTTSLGMPPHPRILSSNVRFPIPNSCFYF